MSESVIVIGAGPAGLAAAHELSKNGRGVLVLEKDAVVGGLSRTVEYKGFRCDIGGHRFFTKIPYVDQLWHQVLGKDFLRRPRLSRIYYGGKFYCYPLRPGNALRNLGLLRSLNVMGSLAWSKIHPRKPEISFTDWVSNRFGRQLFDVFFRSYTEKVWGISCDDLSADWAAQRIRNLSLGKAVLNAIGLGRSGNIASLIEEFDYPALGPGQMYEALAGQAGRRGADIRLSSPVRHVLHEAGKVRGVLFETEGGQQQYDADACLSSMPLDELVTGLLPAPPAEVLEAARELSYRSILTVNLLLDQEQVVPDTWIYIHDPDVRAGRAQFYKNWSPRMVSEPGKSIISLEYFCNEGDALWTADHRQLTDLAITDLRKTRLADAEKVFDAFIVRYAKAYPVYDRDYARRLATIRQYLDGIKNLRPIGRYGQFRYNNMDHSILTGHYGVRALMGEDVDPWSVNVEQEYHETGRRRG